VMCQAFESEQRAMGASEDTKRRRACREAGGHVYHGGSSVCSRCFERAAVVHIPSTKPADPA
jgi:ribosomal protein L37E